ncbi:hypothetical protein BKA82DRAFT_2506873 [Pisolithus tinctorius]|nr:hypothetical protein BKA82DRAFT_2506873 [Pisolithus tinctorius]
MRIIELIAGLPEYVKCIGKFTLNAPFAFNSLNGLRRLCMGHGKGCAFLTSFRSFFDGLTFTESWL